jgi:single-strand DNA-binding protein
MEFLIMLNKIIIMGRLTSDPELRRTGSGTAVASFTLAVDRDYGQNGQKETDFIDCVAWGKGAEFAEKHFSKGKMMIASGRLQIRSWTDKNENKRKSAEVNVENIYFGEAKNDVGSRYESAMQNKGLEPDYPAIYGDDAELPF